MLSAFAGPLLCETPAVDQPHLLEPPTTTPRLIDARLLDAPMRVWCRSGGECSELHFADGSRARVANDGSQIDVLECGTQLQAVLWGPLLLLALAQNDIYCLHASAVLTTNGSAATVILADSGTGKSTLANVAAGDGRLALVDDLCPVSIDLRGRAWIRPRFVQMKWSDAQHWPATQPAMLPVARLGRLQRGPVSAAETATHGEVLRMLLRHTVAACVFDAALLQRHLQFCAVLSMNLARDCRAWVWTTREAAGDPHGAMLELLHLIERNP